MVWEDEDDDDGLFGRRDGKYSGGRGLFDDLEDSPGSLWNTKEKPSDKGMVFKNIILSEVIFASRRHLRAFD